jgi:carbon storage regulator
MLVITRKLNERITIAGNITITVVDIRERQGQVRIGIDAPKDIAIHRDDAIDREPKPKESKWCG